MPTAKVHEIDLHYVERGRGTPLLLVHGFPLDYTMWQGQLDALADQYRVIAPDLRGFGQSGVTAGLATMQLMADDLVQLLDRLAIKEPVVLCGLSMGGYVAWQFGLRYRERLAKLILCDTRAVGDTPETAANRIGLAERVLKEGPSFVAETMLPKLFAPATIDSKARCVEATRQVILRTNPKGIAAASRGMAQRPDVTPWLSRFDMPALVLCGQHDAISTPSEMRGFAEQMPQARFVEIAAAGHMAPLEKPTEVNAAIREFLG
ncbi:MAG: alpha/beta hydrolase [Planctomycetaceae bacterium]|nr:alpha/beta hydrolase [Planctomycetaceae bacterium]